MLLDEEHRRYLSIASGPSLPTAYLQAIDRLEIGPEVGACGSAAFRNETIVIDDIATDYRFASARDFVLSHGLRSCWSQPIRDSRNTVLGTFAIYRRKVASPRPEELRMTRVAAQLAGNAIERIRAEMHLRETIERLNLAETVARFGIWETNLKKGIMTLSAGLAQMMERPVSQFQLTRAEFHAMVHPEAVSYTHLDVYKRQSLCSAARGSATILWRLRRAYTTVDEVRLVHAGRKVAWVCTALRPP